MGAHGADGRVLVPACLAVAALADDPGVKASLADARAGDWVLAALRALPEDTALVEAALQALGNLAAGSVDHAGMIAAAGGIEVVLDRLNALPALATVQHLGCRVLMNLACSPDSHAGIIESHGAGTVVRAMQEHPAHDKVQLYGCWALINLSFSAASEHAIVDAGGVAAIRDAMLQHPKHEQIQFRGCWALAHLAVEEDLQIAIGGDTGPDSAGVVAAVVAALRAHPSSSKVQQHGVWVLSNLASAAANHARLSHPAPPAWNAVDAIFAALHTQMDVSEPCVYYGCRALSLLASDSAICLQMVQSGGVRLALSVLQQIRPSTRVIEQGCALLSVLVKNSADGCAELQRDRQKGALLEVVRQFRDNPDIKGPIDGILDTLYANPSSSNDDD
jgi:hypothetical protein